MKEAARLPRSLVAMHPIARLLATFCILVTGVCASVIEEGNGIIYGKDHVFSLKAPKGWVLDNESAVSSGVHAVFYPKGSTWKDSRIVAYARARPRTDKIKTAADVAKENIEHFRAEGSTKYDGKEVKRIKTKDGKELVIYHFSGDQWGNFEAAAYAEENKTVNFIVLNARDEKMFQEALPAFEELAQSYFFMGEKADIKGPGPSAPKERKKPVK
jgi:hypothetical protein